MATFKGKCRYINIPYMEHMGNIYESCESDILFRYIGSKYTAAHFME